MFSSNDILARLQDGEDATKIAQEMADALNKALDMKRQVDETVAKAETAQRNQMKNEIISGLQKMFNWLNRNYPDISKSMNEMTADKWNELADACLEALDELVSLNKMFVGLEDIFEKKNPTKPTGDANIDVILNEFLRTL